MGWRRINHAFHRDIGYLCIGMTIIYAISGLVLNHTSHSFNPSYTIEKSVGHVTPWGAAGQPDGGYIARVLAEVGETGAMKTATLVAPGSLRIFVEGNTIDVDLSTGQVRQEKVQRRPGLFEVNALHLNKPKGTWTWVADVYAVALLVVALTGLFMIRGRTKWRGLLLTGTGLLVPLLFVVFSL